MQVDRVHEGSVDVEDGCLCHHVAPGRDRATFVPFGVKRVLRHMAVEIGRSIAPPDRPAFAKCSLCVVHGAMGSRLGIRIFVGLRVPDRSPSRHQPLRQLGSLGLIQVRICQPPQPAADDEVPPIRSDRVLHADFRRAPAAGFFAVVSLAGFLPAIGISISF
jgi:hypothetical protein